MSKRSQIEVRSYKWPRRLISFTQVYLLGEDEFGRWLGARQGEPWWYPNGSQGGLFEQSLVKLIPDGTFWTACFHPVDPVVDVDIVLPVEWGNGTLHEVDLELDVLRYADGRVLIRDEIKFESVRQERKMTETIAQQAVDTCEQVFTRMKQDVEPFDTVGQGWLQRFLDTK